MAHLVLENGVHPKIVSEAHATVGITLDTYSHVLPSMSRTAADAIGRRLRGLSCRQTAANAARRWDESGESDTASPVLTCALVGRSSSGTEQ
jgi:hypothetical protein